MATPLQEPRPRGRSARRKPLNLSLDIEPSVTGEGADSPEPSAAAAADPSLSHDEKMALEQLTQNFESSIFEQPQKHKYSSFSNSLALQLNAEAEARGYPTSAYNSLPGHSEGTSDLSSLSSSSRSDSEDSFLLQGHLPSFYSDATPQGSASTLTLLDPSPSSPSWSQRAYAEQGASLNSRPAIALDAQATIQPTTESEQPYDEEDSRMLSFPLKVCAYALALLPIPTSLLSTRSRTQSPPPLPVEVHESPKIYSPRHRDADGLSLPSSPLGSFHSLPSLSSAASPKNRNRKVCFDRVVVIRSPSDSNDDDEEGLQPDEDQLQY